MKSYEQLGKEELIKMIKNRKQSNTILTNKKFPICEQMYVSHWDFIVNEFKIEEDFYTVNGLENQILNVHPEDKYRIFLSLLKHLKSEEDYYVLSFRVKFTTGIYKKMKMLGKVINYDEEHNIFELKGFYKFVENEDNDIKSLKVEKAKFKQLFDNIDAGVVLFDTDGIILEINSKFTEIFGYQLDEIQGKNLDDFIIPENLTDEGILYTQKIIKGESIDVETIRQDKNNNTIDVYLNAFPIKFEYNTIGQYALYYDISERKANERRIKYLSFHDELTDLYNRRYFENELKKYDQLDILPITILIGDLNNLKCVNDDYGHRLGDRYIALMGEILKDSFREEDIVARIGGDEFAVILPKINKKDLKKIVKRIDQKCKVYDSRYDLPVELKISLGYATKHQKYETLENIFIQADHKMYQVKKQFKNEIN